MITENSAVQELGMYVAASYSKSLLGKIDSIWLKLRRNLGKWLIWANLF